MHGCQVVDLMDDGAGDPGMAPCGTVRVIGRGRARSTPWSRRTDSCVTVARGPTASHVHHTSWIHEGDEPVSTYTPGCARVHRPDRRRRAIIGSLAPAASTCSRANADAWRDANRPMRLSNPGDTVIHAMIIGRCDSWGY